MKVLKYEVTTDFYLDLPIGYEVLSVADQQGTAHMWIKVDDRIEALKRVRFIAYATCHSIPDNLELKFIGTFPAVNGMFIFHLFEVLESSL